MRWTLSSLLLVLGAFLTACGGGSAGVTPAGTDLVNPGNPGASTPPANPPAANPPAANPPAANPPESGGPNLNGNYRMGGFEWYGDGDRSALVLLVSCSNGEEMDVNVAGSDIAGPPELFLEDADGTLVSLGEMTPVDQTDRPEKYQGVDLPPEWCWQVGTARGDSLPFGVAKVEELSGRSFEIRDADGAVIVADALPALEAGPWSPPTSPRDPADEPWGNGPPVDWGSGNEIYYPLAVKQR